MMSQRDTTKGKVLVSVAAVIEGKQHEIARAEAVEDVVWRGIEKIAGRRGLKLTNLIERREE